MTVVPSVISHAAVPIYRRRIWPLFSLPDGFGTAKAKIRVATNGTDASADFSMGRTSLGRNFGIACFGGATGRDCSAMLSTGPVGSLTEAHDCRAVYSFWLKRPKPRRS
jgi:hypothetical protein